MRRNPQTCEAGRESESFGALESLEPRVLLSASTVVMPNLGVTLDVQPVVEAKLNTGDSYAREQRASTRIDFIPKIKMEVVVGDPAQAANGLAAATDPGVDAINGIQGLIQTSHLSAEQGDPDGIDPPAPDNGGGDDGGTDCDLPPPHSTPSPCN